MAGRHWNETARIWTTLARAGDDVSRDHLDTLRSGRRQTDLRHVSVS